MATKRNKKKTLKRLEFEYLPSGYYSSRHTGEKQKITNFSEVISITQIGNVMPSGCKTFDYISLTRREALCLLKFLREVL